MVGSYLRCGGQGQGDQLASRDCDRCSSLQRAGRYALVDEMGLDELDREGRLSDTTASDNDEFVLAQELSLRVYAHK